jgi:fucose 4-O-acetylase-like acetyltransferase
VLHDAVVTFLRPEITTRISGNWGDGGVLFFNLSPVWFVWSMGWTELFFHPLRNLTIGKGKGQMAWIALVLVLLTIQIPMYVFLRPAPWCLTILPVFLLFMLIGAKLRDRNIAERLGKVPALPAFITTILCFAAHFGLFVFNGNESYYVSKFGNRGALDVFTVILQILIAAPAMFFLARALGRVKPLERGLQWVGRHTLGILLLHCILGVVFCDILHNYIKPGPYWYLESSGIPLTSEIVLKSILTCVLSLATSIPVIILWEKLKGMLLGRIKERRERRDDKG